MTAAVLALSLLATVAHAAPPGDVAQAEMPADYIGAAPPKVIPMGWTTANAVQTGTLAAIWGAPAAHGGPGMTDVLHVLGFSPDGKVAFYVEEADEAVGGYLWRFEIQDLRSDKSVVKRRWDHDDIDSVSNMLQVRAMYGTTFDADLARHGIALDRSLEVHTLPWTSPEGAVYDVRFESVDGGEFEDVTSSADVFVSLAGRGEKRVGRVTWGEMSDCCGQPRAVLVESPHEDRAALIVGAWSRGWEGPPNVWRHTVIGVHLTERFEAPPPP